MFQLAIFVVSYNHGLLEIAYNVMNSHPFNQDIAIGYAPLEEKRAPFEKISYF